MYSKNLEIPYTFYCESRLVVQRIRPLSEEEQTCFELAKNVEWRKAKGVAICDWSSTEYMESEWHKQVGILCAAGGIVLSPKNDVLMIYRNGKWDIPKGKIEQDEAPHHAALREVREETGVSAQLIEEHPFSITFHLYPHTYAPYPAYLLKKTYWYKMKVEEASPIFAPQREEGISEVVWCSPSEWAKKKASSYPLVEGVLNKLGIR